MKNFFLWFVSFLLNAMVFLPLFYFVGCAGNDPHAENGENPVFNQKRYDTCINDCLAGPVSEIGECADNCVKIELE